MNRPTPETKGREARRRLLHRAGRRRALFMAAVVGLAAGLAAVVFRLLVGLVEDHGHGVAQWFAGHGMVGILGLLVVGGMLGGLAGLATARLCPEAGGSGIPHAKAVLMGLRALRPLRVIGVKIGAGLLALASGMSLGREGPTVHIGAAVGLLVARTFGLPRRTHRSLLAAGAGAGLAAAFNAPLAGFLFVMEELKRELSPLTYGTALLASIAAVAVERWLLDQRPTFLLVDPAPIPLHQLPALALAGGLLALLGVAFNRLLLRGVELRLRRQLPRSLLAAGVGVAMAGLLLVWPEVTCGGIPVAQQILAGADPGAGLPGGLFLLVAAKLLLTVLCFMTGVPGGIFAPMLVMGSLAGFLLGQLGQLWLPLATPAPALMATAGMAAMLAASVRAPLTGVVLIIEMTGQYSLLYALLLAAFAAYACAELLDDMPVYEALLHLDLAHGHAALKGREEIIDFLVEPHSALDGRRIGDLAFPAGALVATVERDQRIIVPTGQSILHAGDVATVVVEQGVETAWLVKLLDAAKGP